MVGVRILTPTHLFQYNIILTGMAEWLLTLAKGATSDSGGQEGLLRVTSYARLKLKVAQSDEIKKQCRTHAKRVKVLEPKCEISNEEIRYNYCTFHLF